MAIRRKQALQIQLTVAGPFPSSYRALVRRTARLAFNRIPKRYLVPFRQAELGIHIVSPATIRGLNKKYRRKNKPTDVLAFSGLEVTLPTQLAPSLGEIFICWEIAKKQAGTFFCTPRQELQRLIVHGLLHVLGYDHERSAREAKMMFSLQEKILKTL